MSEERSQEGRQDREEEGRRDSPLQTGRGDTNVQESVVSRIASVAAQEIEGVRLGGGASQKASGFLGRATGGSGGPQDQGVSVDVGQVEAAVDLKMTIEYGRSIPQVANAVRQNVINRIENLVGLRATEVNVIFDSLFFPEEEEEERKQQQRNQQQQNEQQRGEGRNDSGGQGRRQRRVI